MNPGLEDRLSRTAFEKVSAARMRLRSKMDEAGLYDRDGWKIGETLCSDPRGTLIVMAPLHLMRTAPEMREIVLIDHDGEAS